MWAVAGGYKAGCQAMLGALTQGRAAAGGREDRLASLTLRQASGLTGRIWGA